MAGFTTNSLYLSPQTKAGYAKKLKWNGLNIVRANTKRQRWTESDRCSTMREMLVIRCFHCRCSCCSRRRRRRRISCVCVRMCVAVYVYKWKGWRDGIFRNETKALLCTVCIENWKCFLDPEPDAYKFRITKFSLQHWNGTPMIEVYMPEHMYINGWMAENGRVCLWDKCI